MYGDGASFWHPNGYFTCSNDFALLHIAESGRAGTGQIALLVMVIQQHESGRRLMAVTHRD